MWFLALLRWQSVIYLDHWPIYVTADLLKHRYIMAIFYSIFSRLANEMSPLLHLLTCKKSRCLHTLGKETNMLFELSALLSNRYAIGYKY